MRGNVTPYQAIGSYPLPLGFNGRWAPVYRWFSGRPLNGHRYTDATGFRYGTMALDVSGHATQYQLLPGALRFLYVRLPVMAAGPTALAALAWPEPMYYTGLGLTLLATWRVQRWRQRATFRRQVIEPVSAGASAVLNAKRVAGQGHTWVVIPEDFRDNPEAKIQLMLPLNWIGNDGDKAALVRVVASKLNMDELSPSWSLHGDKPMVTLGQAPAPPKIVSFAEGQVMAEGIGPDEVALGAGPRGRAETFSLVMESPHAILNGGSGAGKSVLLAYVVGQLMRRGAGVLVLDAKFVSHMWLRRVPGVHYASEAEDMHNALVWLDTELIRRARLVSTAKDMGLAMNGLQTLVVVMEEMTAARSRLDQYWKSIKEQGQPALSPALAALANVANMGRELKVHAFLAGQSLTAKVTGGPEGRESYGARLLARATSNAWRMLAPQIKPAPVKRERPGRWHIVVGDTLRAFQGPFIDLKDEATVAELIGWATGAAPGWDVTAAIEAGGGGGGQAEVPSSEPPTPAGISLRAYADEIGVDLKTITRWRERRSDFPVEVGVGARGVKLYDRDHLRAYVRERLREPATLD
jgi:hypothetical protein